MFVLPLLTPEFSSIFEVTCRQVPLSWREQSQALLLQSIVNAGMVFVPSDSRSSPYPAIVINDYEASSLALYRESQFSHLFAF
jgi:hypothetical protein